MVVKPQDLISSLRALLGERETEDEAITFIENLSDTLDDRSNAGYSQEDIDAAVKAKDEEWRKKYVERFESSFSDPEDPGEIEDEKDIEEEIEDNSEDIQIEDLFEEKED